MHRTQQSMVFLFALGLGLFVTPGVAREAGQSDQPVSITAQALVLKNVWLIDGTGAPATGNAWVRIEGDRITAVGTDTPAPIAGARIMDLEGRTVLPGLIDTHVHLSDLEQARWMLKLLLAHGVTTVKDAGNSLENIVNIRRWMLRKAAVPRLFISGTVLAGPPGEMQFLSEGDQTAPRSPWQSPFVERLIGSIRRECLDHMIVFNESHVRRVLRSYLRDYHASRTHLSLGKDAPESRKVESPELGKIIEFPEVGGLHHRYGRRAA